MTVYLDIENKKIMYENNDKLIPLEIPKEEVESIKSSEIVNYVKDKITNLLKHEQ